MSKRMGIILVVILSISLLMSGCQRSASTASLVPATPASPTAIKTTPLENPTKVAPTATKAAVVTSAPSATPKPTLAETTVATTEGGTVQTAAPTSSNPVAIPTLTVPATYTLQKGEWPICIARRFNLDHTQLLAVNHLALNTIPAEGTVLTLPSGTTWSYGDRARFEHPTTYTVMPDDTIYTIACYFGDVSPEAIIAANGLSSPYTLTPGQTIKIP